MTTNSLHDIIPVLQVAIGPVILISGVGLLLLTMTNRLGRAIDRARQLARDIESRPDSDRAHVLVQIATIYRRARLLRLTIALSGMSVLLAAVLIIALFLSALLGMDNGVVIILIFIACLGSLIGSLTTFIYDIHLSLVALKLELKQVKPDLQ
jgi:hypothetical protein